MEFVTTSTSKAADLDPVCPVGRSVHLVTRCWKHRYPTVVRAPRDVPCARGTEAVGRALDAVRAVRRGRNCRVLDVSAVSAQADICEDPANPGGWIECPPPPPVTTPPVTAPPPPPVTSPPVTTRGRRRRRRRRYARARTRLPWSSRPRGTRPRGTRHPPRPRHPRTPSATVAPPATPDTTVAPTPPPTDPVPATTAAPTSAPERVEVQLASGTSAPTISIRARPCCRHLRSSRWVDCSSPRGIGSTSPCWGGADPEARRDAQASAVDRGTVESC